MRPTATRATAQKATRATAQKATRATAQTATRATAEKATMHDTPTMLTRQAADGVQGEEKTE